MPTQKSLETEKPIPREIAQEIFDSVWYWCDYVVSELPECLESHSDLSQIPLENYVSEETMEIIRNMSDKEWQEVEKIYTKLITRALKEIEKEFKDLGDSE